MNGKKNKIYILNFEIYFMLQCNELFYFNKYNIFSFNHNNFILFIIINIIIIIIIIIQT